MNILFYVDSLNPNKGGVERVTSVLVREFKRSGHSCYAISRKDEGEGRDKDIYQSVLKLSGKNKEEWESDIIYFLGATNIDIVINQIILDYSSNRMWYAITKRTKIKVISCMHTVPDFIERVKVTPKLFFLPFWLNRLIYSLHKYRTRGRMKEIVNLAYTYSDKFVLLSDSFVSLFIDYYHIKSQSKIVVQNNPLTYTTYIDAEKINEKEKIALIVARIDNAVKRIDLALEAWVRVKPALLQGWKLQIVGDGPDLDYCKNYASRLGLTNVIFEGRSDNPKKYYERASVLLMTSAYEGWCLALVEAQQMGCVPVAFNSFDSLKEVVQNEKCGFIIKNNDIIEFSRQLSTLMENDHMRYGMAVNAVDSMKKFDVQKICEQWNRIFIELR